MGFQAASKGGPGFHPATGQYLVKVVELVDAPASEEHPDWGDQIRWVFNLAPLGSAEMLKGEDGEPARFNQYTSVKVYKGKKTSRAWEWFCALVKRDPNIGEDIGEALVGAVGQAMVAKDPATQKSKILMIEPFMVGAIIAPPAAPVEAEPALPF